MMQVAWGCFGLQKLDTFVLPFLPESLLLLFIVRCEEPGHYVQLGTFGEAGTVHAAF